MVAPAKRNRTYGTLRLVQNEWHLECEPQVMIDLKRMFGGLRRGDSGVVKLSNTPQICSRLNWFMMQYPLRCDDLPLLRQLCDVHVERMNRLDAIVEQKAPLRRFKLALEPREYQRVAANVYLEARGLLLADDLGLGKTCTSICSFTEPRTLPALIVCPAPLTNQWEREVKRFMPKLTTHIIKESKVYRLPQIKGHNPDVLIISYHKMDGWRDRLAGYIKSVIFDEGQELRHRGSQKYAACKHVASMAEYRLALTATPVYNYGGEIFNVVDVLRPDSLGSWDEFCQEWCTGWGDKPALKDPAAFGAYLREQHIMLRRTRSEVGRELPAITRTTQYIDCDDSALEAIQGSAGELARIILSSAPMGGMDRMQASSQLDMMVRQATGIAKAPYVAAFVKLLLDNGEAVVLYGWHRQVYDIWMEQLKHYSPAMYTGSESNAKKVQEIKRFVEGQTNLLIVSLRSGAGLDGLQYRARTAVFGELDWSPGVHEQCIGRVARDGQKDPVAAYFLLSNDGSDPMIAEVLGIKRHQSDALRGMEHEAISQTAPNDGIRRIAEKYLARS